MFLSLRVSLHMTLKTLFGRISLVTYVTYVTACHMTFVYRAYMTTYVAFVAERLSIMFPAMSGKRIPIWQVNITYWTMVWRRGVVLGSSDGLFSGNFYHDIFWIICVPRFISWGSASSISLTWWSNGLITRGAQGRAHGSHTCPSDVQSPCAHTRTSLVASDYLVGYLNPNRYHKDSLSCESMVW